VIAAYDNSSEINRNRQPYKRSCPAIRFVSRRGRPIQKLFVRSPKTWITPRKRFAACGVARFPRDGKSVKQPVKHFYRHARLPYTNNAYTRTYETPIRTRIMFGSDYRAVHRTYITYVALRRRRQTRLLRGVTALRIYLTRVFTNRSVKLVSVCNGWTLVYKSLSLSPSLSRFMARTRVSMNNKSKTNYPSPRISYYCYYFYYCSYIYMYVLLLLL